jgi:hypothetical protein
MSSNLALSFELICLMDWLLRRDRTLLKLLVKRAVRCGFAQELAALEPDNLLERREQLHGSVLEFVEFFEEMVTKELAGERGDEAVTHDLVPALKKLEHSGIDQKTLWLSIQQTKASLIVQHQEGGAVSASAGSGLKLRDRLMRNLIRNWGPTIEDEVN